MANLNPDVRVWSRLFTVYEREESNILERSTLTARMVPLLEQFASLLHTMAKNVSSEFAAEAICPTPKPPAAIGSNSATAVEFALPQVSTITLQYLALIPAVFCSSITRFPVACGTVMSLLLSVQADASALLCRSIICGILFASGKLSLMPPVFIALPQSA